jgi:hypothetical protein
MWMPEGMIVPATPNPAKKIPSVRKDLERLCYSVRDDQSKKKPPSFDRLNKD